MNNSSRRRATAAEAKAERLGMTAEERTIREAHLAKNYSMPNRAERRRGRLNRTHFRRHPRRPRSRE